MIDILRKKWDQNWCRRKESSCYRRERKRERKNKPERETTAANHGDRKRVREAIRRAEPTVRRERPATSQARDPGLPVRQDQLRAHGRSGDHAERYHVRPLRHRAASSARRSIRPCDAAGVEHRSAHS